MIIDFCAVVLLVSFITVAVGMAIMFCVTVYRFVKDKD
jgi:hypothetical protein